MSTTVRPSRALDDSGFSIVETLFAIVIMAIAFLGMAGVQAVSSKAQTLGRNHDVATALVAQALEQAHRTSFPAITICPLSGDSRPATDRSSVVLPQPEGPSSAIISPGATSRETPSSARTAP